MPELRSLIRALDQQGELLHVSRPVNPQFELASLLKQAEARRKAIVFSSVNGSEFPVVGGLLTDAKRFALGLGLANPERYTRELHRLQVAAALENPQTPLSVESAPCADVVITGDDVDLAGLPVPWCFEHDSGPFLTAAVGISRNPDNGVVNAGIYRILVCGKNQLVISVGPGSDLLKFIATDREAGRTTQLVLAVGASPELLMAASAKVPPELSELDVAGGLGAGPLSVGAAQMLDLPVPADAEFIIEAEINHQETVPNTMGEFGDLYGTQQGHPAKVVAVSHRTEPVFHTIMAGAGKEHNSLGFIILYDIEPDLRAALADICPALTDLRVRFDPPSMGMPGELYLQLKPDSGADVASLARKIFELRCGRWEIGRVIRRIIVVDSDVDIHSPRDITWAVNNRALTPQQHLFFDDIALPGLGLRLAVDATVPPGQQESLQRLIIPGEAEFCLDEYLD